MHHGASRSRTATGGTGQGVTGQDLSAADAQRAFHATSRASWSGTTASASTAFALSTAIPTKQVSPRRVARPSYSRQYQGGPVLRCGSIRPSAPGAALRSNSTPCNRPRSSCGQYSPCWLVPGPVWLSAHPTGTGHCQPACGRPRVCPSTCAAAVSGRWRLSSRRVGWLLTTATSRSFGSKLP